MRTSDDQNFSNLHALKKMQGFSDFYEHEMNIILSGVSFDENLIYRRKNATSHISVFFSEKTCPTMTV